jgi:hypothetical protein
VEELVPPYSGESRKVGAGTTNNVIMGLISLKCYVLILLIILNNNNNNNNNNNM